jgi:hypothetical protein
MYFVTSMTYSNMVISIMKCLDARSCKRATMTISCPALRAVMWLLIAVLAATLTYAAFRSYLSPELLIGFANGFLC